MAQVFGLEVHSAALESAVSLCWASNYSRSSTILLFLGENVLTLMATGMTNQQIADELILARGTVKYYTSQIYGKLAAANRTQAVARARTLGLI